MFLASMISVLIFLGLMSMIFSLQSNRLEKMSLALERSFASTKVTVLGGSGFVGSRVCKQLVERGCKVTSISRNGNIPSWAPEEDWTRSISWAKGDVLTEDISALLRGTDVVVSTIGVIGFDNAALESGNGDANVTAVKAAKKAGAKKFVYVSVATLVKDAAGGLGLLKGYFEGKDKAEKAIKEAFPRSVIIKPSFIYGGQDFNLSPPRVPQGYGSFVENSLSLGFVRSLAKVSLGPLAAALSPPVDVEDVAGAVVASVLGLYSGEIADGTDEIKAASATLQL